MIRIDHRSSKPIYEQIIDEVKYLVIKGYLKHGDAIPSVRRLALELSITPGTVAKAYQELERQKVIETLRGKGTFVSQGMNLLPDQDRLEEIKKQIKTICVELMYMGIGREDAKKIMDESYEALQKGEQKDDGN